jgi:hypothetical protein
MYGTCYLYHMARDVMILMRENAFRGPLAQMALASLVAISVPKKVAIFRAAPSNAPCNGFAHIKIIKFKRHIKNRYFGNFIYMSLAVVVFCSLYSVFCILYCTVVSFMGLSGPIPFNSSPPPPSPFVQNNL